MALSISHISYVFVDPQLLAGLLSIGGLTCASAEGLTFLIVATAVAHVVHLVGATMSLAALAKLLGMCLL